MPVTNHTPRFSHLPLGASSGPQDCAIIGAALLNTPYFNKGAAFPADEREEFMLTGLLPQNVQTLEQQVKRAYQQYSLRPDDLAKSTFMASMRAQNEVLFYRVSLDLVFSRDQSQNHMLCLQFITLTSNLLLCQPSCFLGISEPLAVPSLLQRSPRDSRHALNRPSHSLKTWHSHGTHMALTWPI